MMNVTKELIKDRYDKYNRAYFGGVLGKCRFFFLNKNCPCFGRYTCHRNSKGELISDIWVGRNTVWNEENLREILIHEMIHMYVRTIDNRRVDGILGHGWRFMRQCHRIKREYGIGIRKHPNFGFINKKLYPKMWERVVLFLIDW